MLYGLCVYLYSAGISDCSIGNGKKKVGYFTRSSSRPIPILSNTCTPVTDRRVKKTRTGVCQGQLVMMCMYTCTCTNCSCHLTIAIEFVEVVDTIEGAHTCVPVTDRRA